MLEPPGKLRHIEEPAGPVEPEESSGTAPPSDGPPAHSARRFLVLLPPLALGLIVWALYAGTIPFPFHFDDHIYLLSNPFVADPMATLRGLDFGALATHSVRWGHGLDPSLNLILRPFAYLTFHANHMLAGFNPGPFRVVNILIHAANGMLLFLLLRQFLARSPRGAALGADSRWFIPVAASLLFAVHPLQTESVTYIVQRFTSLAAMFTLGALNLQFLSLSASRPATVALLRAGAVVFLLAGMLTKECTITVPILAVVLHVAMGGLSWRQAVRQALPLLFCLPVLPIMVFLTSKAQYASSDLATALHVASSDKNSAYHLHYVLTQTRVLVDYLRVIFWPVSLNIDRDYDLSTSPADIRVLASSAVLFLLAFLSWAGTRRRVEDARIALAGACGAWFFLALVASSGLVPLDDLMVDHRTYGATLAVATAVACGLDLVRTGRWQPGFLRWAVPTLVLVVAGILGRATMARNQVWRTPISLWTDAAEKSPNKGRPWDNLGICHYLGGRPVRGIHYLIHSVTVEPGHTPGYAKLGSLLNTRGAHADAAEWSRKGIAVAPDHAVMHYNLGVALCGMSRMEDGIAALREAIRLYPDYVAAHFVLGQMHLQCRDHEIALRHFHAAAALGMDAPELQELISITQSRLGGGQAGVTRSPQG